jgi:DNA/RNA-binding domain of Phe-tRNA-synthetase-like protein
MGLEVAWALDHPGLLVGLVRVAGITLEPSGGQLDQEIADTIARRAAGEQPSESLRTAVRDMLRFGGFKPTGRSKPASEYLAGAADRGEFPRINNAVDVANDVSLASGLPISLLDADLALDGAPGLCLRFGLPGERYVFNRAGHEIELAGLVCAARVGGTCIGNAVKDALDAKTVDDTRNLVAFVYAPRSAVSEAALDQLLRDFAARLVTHAGGVADIGQLPAAGSGPA